MIRVIYESFMSSQDPNSPLPPRLLVAARTLLERGGPEALTMEALASESGISRATLYRRVGSREALLDRLVDEGLAVGAREDPRERILDAAARAFGRSGFDGVTVEQIAELAGVGTATVYRHFGDKDSLILALASTRGGRGAMRGIEARLTGDLRQDLTTIAAELLRTMVRDGDLMRLVLIEMPRHPELKARVEGAPDRMSHGLQRYFAAQIAAGLLPRHEPANLSLAFMGPLLVQGLLRPTFFGEGPMDPDKLAAYHVSLFLDGALAAPLEDSWSPPPPPRPSH